MVFSEPVAVSGTGVSQYLYVSLENGTASKRALAPDGALSSVHVFSYVVEAGFDDADGLVVAADLRREGVGAAIRGAKGVEAKTFFPAVPPDGGTSLVDSAPPPFELVAGSVLARSVSGNVAEGGVLRDADPDGGGFPKVTALAPYPSFAVLRRTEAGVDCSAGQSCEAASVFCASSDAAVHPGFDVSLGSGQETAAVDLPASRNPSGGPARVTFTCRAVPGGSPPRWLGSGRQLKYRFAVEFQRVTTNGKFEFTLASSRRRGLRLNPGDVVGVGTDALEIREKASTPATIALRIKAGVQPPADDLVIECLSDAPEVLSADGLTAPVGSVTIPAGSAAEQSLTLPVPQNVASDQTVTVTCRPTSTSGDWTPETTFLIFEVQVTADPVATGSTADRFFTVVAGPYAYSSVDPAQRIAEGTALTNAAPFPVASEGVAWDNASASFGLLAVRVNGTGWSGSFRVRCASEFPDVIPTFTTGEIAAPGPLFKSFEIPAGGVTLAAATEDVRFECQLVADGERSAVAPGGSCAPACPVWEGAGAGQGPINEMYTFTVQARKQRLRPLAGTWAFDAFSGRRMSSAADPLGPHRDAGEAARRTVLVTAQSSLEAGDLVLLQDASGAAGSLAVTCTADGDPDFGGTTAVSVTAAPTGVPLAAPASVAAEDDMKTVVFTCAGAPADLAQFRLARRRRRLSVAGAARAVDAADGSPAAGAALSPYAPAPGALPRVAVSSRTHAEADELATADADDEPAFAVPLECVALAVPGQAAHLLVPRAFRSAALDEMSLAPGAASAGLYLPASASEAAATAQVVRFSCHPDLPHGPPAGRRDGAGAADLASEWAGSDRAVFELVLRPRRLKFSAGTFVYRASDGAKVAQGTPLAATDDDLTPTLAAFKAYAAGALVQAAPLTVAGGDAYTSSPSVPATVTCTSSDASLLDDFTFAVSANETAPLAVRPEGAAGSKAQPAQDTLVTFTCRPDAAYGAGDAPSSWSPADVSKFRVQVREARVVAKAGKDARRTSLTPMTPYVTVISPRPTGPDALAVTENFAFDLGRQVQLYLAETTDPAFTLQVACTSSAPGVLSATPAALGLAVLPGTLGPVDLPMTTFNVGVDTPVLLECGPDPAAYAAGGVPAGGRVFMTDVAVVSVTVLDNIPPASGLGSAGVVSLPAVAEDGDPLVFDIRTVGPTLNASGQPDAAALDPDVNPGGGVTFETLCEPAQGAVVWTDERQGVFRYTPNPDAFGTDALVFRVVDDLGAQSPLGIVELTITPVPDPPAATDRAFTVLDGALGRTRIFWVGGGLASDPDGIGESSGHSVVITKLPSIPGDLSVDDADVLEWQTADLQACAPPPAPAANPCLPRRVRPTSFVYETGLNSLTAFDGTDSVQFLVEDPADGLQSAVGTASLVVKRQGDNNIPPTADANVGITLVEEATEWGTGAGQIPYIYPNGTDELLSRAQLRYQVNQPKYGKLVLWCPEPESWANRDKPLVVTPPEMCPTTFGARTQRPAQTTLPDGTPVTTCNPACIATDSCTAAQCLEAGGVLDPRSPGASVASDVPGETASRVPVLIYTPPANFFGVDTITYRTWDAFSSSSAASVSVTVTNKADPPQLLCDPSPTNSFLEGKGSELHDLALLLSRGPERNWHHGDAGVDVLPCAGATSVPDGQPDGPGVRFCGVGAEPDFRQARTYASFAASVTSAILEDLFALPAEPPQVNVVKALQSLRRNGVIFTDAGAQVVCSGYRALKAPMRAQGLSDGDVKFALYLYDPDAADAGRGLRYAVRELTVARDPGDVAGPAPTTANLDAVLFTEELEAQVVEDRTTLADIYRPDGLSDVGALTKLTDLSRVSAAPLFLSYRAPDLQAGNVLQRFEWGYFDEAAATPLADGQTVDKVDNFVPVGTVDIHVSCAPGFRAAFRAGKADPAEALNVWACEACAAGSFNLPGVEDQTGCSLCPAGTSSTAGSTRCVACAVGTYAPADGSPACLRCPDPNMVTGGEGSRRLSDCRCPAGFFRPASAPNTCVACDPDDTLCVAEDQEIPLPAREGVRVDPGTGAPLACVMRAACPKHADTAAVLAGACAVGYQADPGEACDRCDVGFYKSGFACKRCQNYTWAIIAIGLLGVVLLAPLMIKLAQKDVFASVNILVVFFQTTFVFAEFRWEWPEVLLDFFDYLSIFALNIELMSPECFVGEFSSLHKIWMMNLVPVSVIAVIMACLPLMLWGKRRAELAAGKYHAVVVLDRMIAVGEDHRAVRARGNLGDRSAVRLWVNAVQDAPHREPSYKLVVETPRKVLGLRLWRVSAVLDVQRDLVWRGDGAEGDGVWCEKAPHAVQIATRTESDGWVGEAGGNARVAGGEASGPAARRVMVLRAEHADRLWMELQQALGRDPSLLLSGVEALRAVRTLKIDRAVVLDEEDRRALEEGLGDGDGEGGGGGGGGGGGAGETAPRPTQRTFSQRSSDILRRKIEYEKAKLQSAALRAELGAGVEDAVLFEVVQRMDRMGGREERDKLYSASLLILQLMFFVMLQTNLVYFDCSASDNAGATRLVWNKEPTTVCYDFSGLHGKMLPVVGLGLLLYGVGIPALFMRILVRNRGLIARRKDVRARLAAIRKDPGDGGAVTWSPEEDRAIGDAIELVELVYVAGFMFKRFKAKTWWYEIMVLARKVAIALVFLFGAPLEQILAMFVVLLVSVSVVLWQKPYADNSLTLMETWALVGNMVIVLFGAIFFLDKFPSEVMEKVGIASLVTLAVVSVVLLLMMLLDAVPKLRVLVRTARYSGMRGMRGANFLVGKLVAVLAARAPPRKRTTKRCAGCAGIGARRRWSLLPGAAAAGPLCEACTTGRRRPPRRVLSARDRWQMVGALVRWMAVPPRKALALRFARELFPGFDEMKRHHAQDSLHFVQSSWVSMVGERARVVAAGTFNAVFAWEFLGVRRIHVGRGVYREQTPYAEFRRYVLSLRPDKPARCPKTQVVDGKEVRGNCKGTGRCPGQERTPCATCRGTGQVPRPEQHRSVLGGTAVPGCVRTVWCPDCGGEGGRFRLPCSLECGTVQGYDDLDKVLDALATLVKARGMAQVRREVRLRSLLGIMESDWRDYCAAMYKREDAAPGRGGGAVGPAGAADAGDCAAQRALEDAIRAMLESPHGMAPGQGEFSDAGSVATRDTGRSRFSAAAGPGAAPHVVQHTATDAEVERAGRSSSPGAEHGFDTPGGRSLGRDPTDAPSPMLRKAVASVGIPATGASRPSKGSLAVDSRAASQAVGAGQSISSRKVAPAPPGIPEDDAPGEVTPEAGRDGPADQDAGAVDKDAGAEDASEAGAGAEDAAQAAAGAQAATAVRRAFGDMSAAETDASLGFSLLALKRELVAAKAARHGGKAEGSVDAAPGEGEEGEAGTGGADPQRAVWEEYGFWMPDVKGGAETSFTARLRKMSFRSRHRDGAADVPAVYRSKKHRRYVREMAEMSADWVLDTAETRAGWFFQSEENNVLNPFRQASKNPFSRDFTSSGRFSTGILRVAHGSAAALEFVAFAGTDAFRDCHGLTDGDQEERASASRTLNKVRASPRGAPRRPAPTQTRPALGPPSVPSCARQRSDEARGP